MKKLLAVLLVGLSAPAQSQTIVAAAPHTSNVNGFIVTEGDIGDRPYTEMGLISVKAGKLTWVSKNPNYDTVDAKLREKAKKMGAHAVVKVRYLPTGASAMSWGGLKAEGVAIRYNPGR